MSRTSPRPGAAPLLALGLTGLLLAGCTLSGAEPASSSSPSSSTTPLVEGSTPATAPVAPVSPSSSATVEPTSSTPAAVTPTASRAASAPVVRPSGDASARPSASTSTQLPDSFAGWTKVAGGDGSRVPTAGYSSERGTVQLQLEDTSASARAVLVGLTGGRYLPIDGTPCAAGARRQACATTRGDRLVVLSSTTLETEELAPLVAQAADALR